MIATHSKNQQDIYKVVIIGDAQVGKTSLCKQLITGSYDEKYLATVGVEVHPFNHDGIKIRLWDCAGDPRYAGLRDGYYLDVDLIIVANPSTAKTNWNNIAKKYCNNVMNVNITRNTKESSDHDVVLDSKESVDKFIDRMINHLV